ncbi:hypothetical protein KQH40_00935 [bacterium]|nr:hypothetical protein [bacterium]
MHTNQAAKLFQKLRIALTVLITVIAFLQVTVDKVWASDDPPSPIDCVAPGSCTSSCEGNCTSNGEVDTSPGENGSGGTNGNGSTNGTNGSTGTEGYEDGGLEGLVSVQGTPWCSPAGGSPEEQIEAGAGGISTISLNGTSFSDGEATCSWTCGDETIDFHYDGESEGWNVTGIGSPASSVTVDYSDNTGFNYSGVGGNPNDWAVSTYGEGGAAEAGLPTCSQWGGESSTRSLVEQICWQELQLGSSSSGGANGTNGSNGNNGEGGTSGSNGISGVFVCTGDYDVSAAASVPCPAVERWPYPRGLVNAPIEFVIQASGASSADGSREWCEQDIMNYTISVGWEQVPIPPLWNWDERPWSAQPTASYGFQVYHTYETSSFGKPENGPDTMGNMDHPAYQVEVVTYWQPWLKVEWDQWAYTKWDCKKEVVDQVWNSETNQYEDVLDWVGTECTQRLVCSNAGIAPYPTASNCGEWDHRSTGTIRINLLEFGFSEPYYRFFGAVDTTTPPSPLPYNEPRQCRIPVPVVESQSLLTVPEVP